MQEVTTKLRDSKGNVQAIEITFESEYRIHYSKFYYNGLTGKTYPVTKNGKVIGIIDTYTLDELDHDLYLVECYFESKEIETKEDIEFNNFQIEFGKQLLESIAVIQPING